MDDIQSWWEVPSIAHFCSLFRAAFNLLDFDIEELEEALLTDGTEDPGNSLLQDLIVRLLCGCLGNNDISTFNFQMFLRRLFRQKCQEYEIRNPFNSDIDFQFLPLRTKVEILHTLCDFRLDADDVLDLLKNLEADSLRVEPLGYDENNSTYWYFYGTRLYREDYPKIKKKIKEKKRRDKTIDDKKRNRLDISNDDSDEEQEIIGDPVWQVICFTQEDWDRITTSFRNSSSKVEQELYITLSQDFLPEIPRLFAEKERLQKKRLYLPRRYSSRIDRLKRLKEEEEKKLEKQNKVEVLEKKESLRERKKDNEDDLNIEDTEPLLDTEREKPRPRSLDSSTPILRNPSGTSLGRQTNNSLSSATGKIVIQNRRTKLKSSQIFRQTEEDLQTGLYKILENLKNHEDSWPFAEPVDEHYAPRYYSIITQPMDLEQMEEKLDKGEYMSLSAFRKDFQLIINNCRRYNGSDNEYTEMAGNLQIAFDQAASRYLESDVSSDEEIAIEFLDTVPLASFLEPAKEIIESQSNLVRRKKVSPLKQNIPSKFRTSPSKESKSPLREISKSPSPLREEILSSPSSPQEGNHSLSRLSRPLPSPTHSNSKSPPRKLTKSPNRLEKIIRLSEHSPPEKQKSLSKKRNKSPSRKKMKQSKSKSPFRQNTYLSPTRKRAYSSPPHILTSPSPSPSPPPPKSPSIKNSPLKRKRKNTRKASQPKRRKNQSSDESDKDSINNESDEAPPSPIPVVKPTKKRKPQNIKDPAAIEALEIVTEQTLKDINKWLDETPRYSEFSSRSPTPTHSGDEIDSPTKNSNKIGAIPNFSNNISNPNIRKDIRGLRTDRRIGKDAGSKQRKGTIDRLQPGKSKGNLLAKAEVVAVDTSAGGGSGGGEPNGGGEGTSLSLGSVLAADILKFDAEAALAKSPPSSPSPQPEEAKGSNSNNEDTEVKPTTKPSNLSAWFKAFGAPKRKDTSQNEEKRIANRVQSPIRPVQSNITNTTSSNPPPTTITTSTSTSTSTANPIPTPTPTALTFIHSNQLTRPPPPPTNVNLHPINKVEEDRERPSSTASSDRPDSRTGDHGPPIERQRKASTGSSVSERSSFSQDPDSGELGGFPAPYPSPLHHSPDEPIVVNETYPPAPPPINGSLRVGFYQDTTASKLSPEKTTSPLPFNASQVNPSYGSSLPFYEPIKTNEQFRSQESPPIYASSSSQAKPNVYPVKKRVYNEPQPPQLTDPQNQGFNRTSFQSLVDTYPTTLPIYSQPKVPITTYSNLNNPSSPPSYSQSTYPATLNQYELPHTSSSEDTLTQPLAESTTSKPARKRKTKAAFQEYQKETVLPSTDQKDATSITLNQKDTVPIALKTASVVPGSAFNFGPAPPGLAIYADKDAYPSVGYLEDYRAPSSFFISNSEEKPNAHGFLPSGQPPNFAYATGPAPPPPPPGPPMFQQYLRHQEAVILHPGLLGAPPPGFPRNYPPLDIRQQFDSLNRPSWP